MLLFGLCDGRHKRKYSGFILCDGLKLQASALIFVIEFGLRGTIHAILKFQAFFYPSEPPSSCCVLDRSGIIYT